MRTYNQSYKHTNWRLECVAKISLLAQPSGFRPAAIYINSENSPQLDTDLLSKSKINGTLFNLLIYYSSLGLANPAPPEQKCAGPILFEKIACLKINQKKYKVILGTFFLHKFVDIEIDKIVSAPARLREDIYTKLEKGTFLLNALFCWK